MNTLKILLDTNFYFVPIDFKIDIFQEFDRIIQAHYQLLTMPAILEELKNLIKKKKNSIKWEKRIQMALKVADKCEISDEPIDPNEKIDDFITRLAKKYDWIVATNDTNLKKKLRNNKIRIIHVRQKSHLILEGSLF